MDLPRTPVFSYSLQQVQREELGLVYELTPATPFSPRDARKQRKKYVGGGLELVSFPDLQYISKLAS